MRVGHNKSMRRAFGVAAFFAAVAMPWAPAFGDGDDGYQYFIAMRAPQLEPAPRYVGASTGATETQTVAYAGCDGATYYLTPGDAAAVAAAIANANTVQMQIGAVGAPAESSSIMCLIQASP